MTQSTPVSDRPFVLVHGAWHGGWCWDRVAAILGAEGRRVFAPTFTGLGDRAHLISPQIGLETFIRDIAIVIEQAELADVVLVGHSFGGVVATCVADRWPARIAHLVYLDAAIPRDGESTFDLMDPTLVAARRAIAQKNDGFTLPAPKAGSFGVRDDDDASWLETRLTPQPIEPYASEVSLSAPSGHYCPVTYIACIAPAYPPMAVFHAWAKAQRTWTYREIATGHDAMVIAPGLVAGELGRAG